MVYFMILKKKFEKKNDSVDRGAQNGATKFTYTQKLKIVLQP